MKRVLSSADGPQTALYQRFEARRPHQEIAALAERQHGLVSLEQLRGIGLSSSAVLQRVRDGKLHRVYEGVYSVGYLNHDLDGHRMAAVLACGPNAVLSHRSAVALWKLRPERPGAIDVTAPNRRGRIPSGIAAHRDGSLTDADRTSIRGIPCTSIPRTLLDFAGVATVSELRKAISEAEVLRTFDMAAVHEVIKRSRGRRGVARLRMLVSELSPETARTRSYLERRFLTLCERAAIPVPEVNCMLNFSGELLQPDFLWRDGWLIIEADGRKAHGTLSAFERDRRRDQILSAAGWQVVRCTWHQVLDEPERIAHMIRTLLAPKPADGPQTADIQRFEARRRAVRDD